MHTSCFFFSLVCNGQSGTQNWQCAKTDEQWFHLQQMLWDSLIEMKVGNDYCVPGQ